ncbi:MAG TPA: hypothetical protein VGK74_05040 [Symbiobacteriaceae bacterium]
MRLASLLVLGQAVPAFLALDLFFRLVPVQPAGLKARLARCARGYAGLAAACCVAGGLVQARAAGSGGLVVACLSGLPWWLLWRFGMRKQFTFLYQSAPLAQDPPD